VFHKFYNEEEEEYLDLIDRYSDIILDYDIDYHDEFVEVVV
jgi:hypothetical protein